MDGGCIAWTGEVRAFRSNVNRMMEMGIMECLWSVAVMLLNSLNDTVTIVLREELKKDSSGGGSGGSGLILDCIVCLNQVSPGEEYRNLPNCNHGPQFHCHCLDAWLTNHSTCPLCRSHIPRPLLQRLHAFSQHYYDAFLSYLHSALDNVSKSIGEIQY